MKFSHCFQVESITIDTRNVSNALRDNLHTLTASTDAKREKERQGHEILREQRGKHVG